MSILGAIAFETMAEDSTDHKFTLGQLLAWCHQMPSFNLNQCWQRSMMPYGVTSPQYINVLSSASVQFTAYDKSLAICMSKIYINTNHYVPVQRVITGPPVKGKCTSNLSWEQFGRTTGINNSDTLPLWNVDKFSMLLFFHRSCSDNRRHLSFSLILYPEKKLHLV